MSFESQFDKPGIIYLGRAQERLNEELEHKMKGREMDDFADLYTAEGIQADRSKLEYIKEKIDEKERSLRLEKGEDWHEKHVHSKEMADSFEGVLSSAKTWFGINAETYPTTEFDDVINGVDVVIEHNVGGAFMHNGAAIDITYGGPKFVHKKLDKIAKKIMEKGQLSEVKYFKSEKANITGRLNNIPTVVVGASADTVMELVNLYAEKNDAELARHPFQFQVIDQILSQCEFFIEIAASGNLPEEKRDQVVNAYRKLREVVLNVQKLKGKTLPDVPKDIRDDFHRNLMHELDELRKGTI
jgi:hypothetical protein